MRGKRTFVMLLFSLYYFTRDVNGCERLASSSLQGDCEHKTRRQLQEVMQYSSRPEAYREPVLSTFDTPAETVFVPPARPRPVAAPGVPDFLLPYLRERSQNSALKRATFADLSTPAPRPLSFNSATRLPTRRTATIAELLMRSSVNANRRRRLAEILDATQREEAPRGSESQEDPNNKNTQERHNLNLVDIENRVQNSRSVPVDDEDLTETRDTEESLDDQGILQAIVGEIYAFLPQYPFFTFLNYTRQDDSVVLPRGEEEKTVRYGEEKGIEGKKGETQEAGKEKPLSLLRRLQGSIYDGLHHLLPSQLSSRGWDDNSDSTPAVIRAAPQTISRSTIGASRFPIWTSEASTAGILSNSAENTPITASSPSSTAPPRSSRPIRLSPTLRSQISVNAQRQAMRNQRASSAALFSSRPPPPPQQISLYQPILTPQNSLHTGLPFPNQRS